MALNKLVLIVLLLFATVTVPAFIRAGQFAHLTAVKGDLVSLATGDGCQIAWVEQDDAEARLVAVRRRGEQPSVLLRAPGISAVAVAGGAAFVTVSTDDRGQQDPAALMRVDIASGQPEQIAPLASPAEEAVAGDGFVCWREHRGPAVPGAQFVVAAAPLDVIRARDTSFDVTRTLAVIPGGAVPSARSVGLVGVADEHVYWLERRRVAAANETLIWRAALPHGEPVTVAREPGVRRAVIAQDSILWTAPSTEAPRERSYSAVKRMFIGDSVADVIADWLGSDGELQASDATVYFREQTRLWCLGGAREEQRSRPWSLPGAVGTRIVGDAEYAFVHSRSGLVLGTRPLTWSARLLRMLGW
jgi:hypothetical protein